MQGTIKRLQEQIDELNSLLNDKAIEQSIENIARAQFLNGGTNSELIERELS